MYIYRKIEIKIQNQNIIYYSINKGESQRGRENNERRRKHINQQQQQRVGSQIFKYYEELKQLKCSQEKVF